MEKFVLIIIGAIIIDNYLKVCKQQKQLDLIEENIYSVLNKSDNIEREVQDLREIESQLINLSISIDNLKNNSD